MRIRKHAKISPLIYATSSLKPGTVLQTHVCQLNQSPWDVMSFSPPSTPPPPPPPPPSQVDCDDVSAGNGSSVHCVSVVESNISDDRDCNNSRQWEYSDDLSGDIATDKAVKKIEQIVMCCKTDGKSWHCRREAAKGNSLCEHHLSLAKSYHNNLSHHAKKSDKPAPPPPLPAEARRRPRPIKKASTTSSNPHDFYYYSGFGPRWGKKRGGETGKNNVAKSIGHDQENESTESPPAFSRIGDDEFDYSEYEDEDDDEENRYNGKKRVRKPIKARSLKSLM